MLGPFDAPAGASEQELRTLFAPAVEGVGDRLLDVRWVTVEGIEGVRLTTEESIDLRGRGYRISLYLPAGGSGWGISVHAEEQGATGVRETVLGDRFIREMPPDHDPITLGEHVLARVRAEAMDERWDADFPDHPLSIVRAAVARIEGSITFHPDVPLSPIPREMMTMVTSMAKAAIELDPEPTRSGWRVRRRERRRRRRGPT